MRYFTLLILIFLFALPLKSQDKYLIYFADKGTGVEGELSKTSPLYKDISTTLTSKSIERRKKTLNENYILFEDIPVNNEYVDELELMGVEIVHKLNWFNAVSAYLPDGMIKDIDGLDFVESIEIVRSFRNSKPELPSDQQDRSILKSSDENLYDYGLSSREMDMSEIPAVHNMGITGSGVIIGMIDAGFDWEGHPALSDMDVIAERDFVYGDEDTGNEGDGYHGTETVSLVGGYEPGQLVAPSFDASFILAKSEDIRTERRVEEDNFAAAVQWMESLGVDIINTSLGYGEFDPGEQSYSYDDMDGKTSLVTRALEMAFSRGVVTVTSAGNEGNDSWFYITAPADGVNTITVGAVNSDGNATSFSSRGPTSDGRIKPEVMAYGSSNYVAYGYSEGYGFKSGTSYSSPIVAGICGQLLSVYPHLNNRQMRQTIIESGDNTGDPDNIMGYGIVSALEAVTFPNLMRIENEYYINKIFDFPIEEGDTVFLIVHEEGSDVFEIYEMETNDGLIYTAMLNGYSENDEINFSFEYFDSGNTPVNDPEEGAYNFIYGSDIVLYNTDYSGNPFGNIPEEYALEQNFPNPFNPATTIIYKLPENSNIKIRIYNVLGELVRTLVDNTLAEGEYSIRWGGVDDKGVKVSSGIYIYTLETSRQILSKKMILLK